MTRRKRVVRKSWSEMTTVERIKECEAAIVRLELTLSQGDNRFGEYGRLTYDALNRQRKTLAILKHEENK